jgi:hypothetical protein
VDRRKVLIVVVVVIVVLFVVGVGAGASSDSNQKIDSSELNADWLKSLQSSFAKPQALTSQDVSTAAPPTCLQPGAFVVNSGETCLFLIRRSSSPATRRLTLNLSEGASVDLTLQQKSAVTLKATLTISDTSGSWDVYQDGGTLSLLCQDSGQASACRLDITK